MKQYNVVIKDYTQNIISITNQKGKSYPIDFREFISEFYQSRNFPFAGLVLPKVVCYFSPVFEYNHTPYAFLITQMKPTVGGFASTEGTIFPWSFVITFVNMKSHRITESSLFYGDSQFFSEDMHEFHLPHANAKAPQSNFSASKLFTHVTGYKGKIFRTANNQKFNRNTFGPLINAHRAELGKQFKDQAEPDVKWVSKDDIAEIEEEGEIETRLATYYEANEVVKMADIDEFCLKEIQNLPSFYEIVEKLWERKANE